MFAKPACASPLWLSTSRAITPCEEPRIAGMVCSGVKLQKYSFNANWISR